MPKTVPVKQVCKIITTGFDPAGLPILAVDCPNRPTTPGVETCLDCEAFVMLASTLNGTAADVVCTPETVRAKVRLELGLPAEASACGANREKAAKDV